MSLKDFKIIKKLGEGSYSAVYQVKRVSDGELYALKKVKMQELSEKEKVNAINEIRILASIKHPNIVSYKEAFIEDATSTLCLVMEFAQNGDLYAEIVDCQKKTCFPDEDWVWRMFIQMTRGLKALHSLKILHRDIKSANIFLSDEKLTAKLGDLNVSKVAKKGLLYTQTGTPYYASPEVWRDMPYDHKSDIWSLGCVIYELIALKPPFRSETMEGLFKKILAGKYPRIPAQFSNDMSKLIRSLLQVQPHLRPNCDKILEMPIVHQRVIRMFPESVPQNQYDNILLKTIRMPKNLLYLTGSLPTATYEDQQNGHNLQLPEPNKKHKTIQADSERQNDRSLRFLSLQRGGHKASVKQDLNKSELLPNKQVNFKTQIDSDDNLDNDDYQDNEEFQQFPKNSRVSKIQAQSKEEKEKNRKEILDMIIDTTKKIDKQLYLLENKDQLPNIQENPLRKKKKKVDLNKSEMIDNNINQEDLIVNKTYDQKTKRIVMQDGVYDRDTMEQPTKYDKLLKQVLSSEPSQPSLGGPFGNRSHSVNHQKIQIKSRILRDNTSQESSQERNTSVFPKIFKDSTSQNTGIRNANHNYLKIQPQTQDYGAAIFNNNSGISPTNHIQPTNSDRYLQYLNKPQIGINQDRFNIVSQREKEQNRLRNLVLPQTHQQRIIPNLYNVNREYGNMGQDMSHIHNSQQVSYQTSGTSNSYGSYNIGNPTIISSKNPQQNNLIPSGNGQHNINLGVGNQVDYFQRLYPQY